MLRKFTVPFPARLDGTNDLESPLSAVGRDEASLDDVADYRLAVVYDSGGPQSQEREYLERRYRVASERRT